MYAQKLEGDSWIGERMDLGKIDKMSGSNLKSLLQLITNILKTSNSARCMNSCRQYGRSSWRTANQKNDGVIL